MRHQTKILRIVLLILLILQVRNVAVAETLPETKPETLSETRPETRPETQPESRPETRKVYPDMPEFQGIESWFNSEPLTKASLKGQVVLVDFWTYTCINCIRTLPVLKEWYRKYKDRGLVIIGVHSPEFSFEQESANIRKAIDRFNIPYPIASDSQMLTWRAYENNAWPAHYFIDANGKIRGVHVGEGDEAASETLIQSLLAEIPSKNQRKAGKPAPTPPQNFEPVDFSQIHSPETYTGFVRRERLITSGRPLELNEWNYEGSWELDRESLFLKSGTGKIRFHFYANKVNLVIHPSPKRPDKKEPSTTNPDKPMSALIRLDGQVVSPAQSGKDVTGGQLLITEPRLYELIRLPQGEEHTIEIEFLNPGISVYAFTFG